MGGKSSKQWKLDPIKSESTGESPSINDFTRPERKREFPELGVIRWGDDVPEALSQGSSSGLPVALLFDELPGCSTCVRFGADVLSHPLLAEALETLFVPVAVNNRPMKDKGQLSAWKEPMLNNPVLRFINPKDKSDLVPRRDGVWDLVRTVDRVVQSLAVMKRPVPEWLKTFHWELSVAEREVATIAMACFWVGEAGYGTAPGVLSTRPGWKATAEVVRVEFDPAMLSYADLLAVGKKFGVANHAYPHSEEQATAAAAAGVSAGKPGKPSRLIGGLHAYDTKHSLFGRVPLCYVPMTPSQAAKVNSALATRSGAKLDQFLSPRQLRLAAVLEQVHGTDSSFLPKALGKPSFASSPYDVQELWTRVQDVLGRVPTATADPKTESSS